MSEQRKVYVASKTDCAPIWRACRDTFPACIISTWIDEAGENETDDYAELAALTGAKPTR
jgi:hypothetical protein